MTEPADAPHSDADSYGFFMSALFGLIDDAQLSGYSQEATDLMLRARDLFMREFIDRHPGHWEKRERTLDDGG